MPISTIVKILSLLALVSAIGYHIRTNHISLSTEESASHVLVENVEVPLRDAPQAVDGARIIQMSDFHFNSGDRELAPALVEEVLAKANAEIRDDDIVVLTGDFIDYEATPLVLGKLRRFVSRLRAKTILAVLGNHDDFVGARHLVRQALERGGAIVLENEHYDHKGMLRFVGTGDGRHIDAARAFHLTPRRQDRTPETGKAPIIALVHNPDDAYKIAPYRADLQISGHTHGGQIHIPFGLGPIVPWVDYFADLYLRYCPSWLQSPSMMHRIERLKVHKSAFKHWKWSGGLHDIRDHHPDTNRWLYINKGLASTFRPIRMFCPPMISVITLRAV